MAFFTSSHDFINVLLPILVPFRHTDPQRLVDLRLEVLETQVLQFILDPPDSKAVRQRRIDLQRLLGDLLSLGRAEMFQGAHVVQPVGELDENDPDIVRHRKHHLAEILRLFFFIVPKRNLADFGHSVDKMHDILPELLFEFQGRGDRIFQGIVQQSGDNGSDIRLEMRSDIRRRRWDVEGRVLRNDEVALHALSQKTHRPCERGRDRHRHCSF